MSPCPVVDDENPEQPMACEYDRPHPGLPHIWWAAAPTRREDEKPGLTCGNDPKQAFESGSLASENEAVRACVNTPDPASPVEED